MKKKWLKAVVIISVIVVLIGGGLLYYFKDMIFNNTHDSELGEYYGLFGYAPDTSEESLYIDYSAHMASFCSYASQIYRGQRLGFWSRQRNFG
jgi:hypothetical protein